MRNSGLLTFPVNGVTNIMHSPHQYHIRHPSNHDRLVLESFLLNVDL